MLASSRSKWKIEQFSTVPLETMLPVQSDTDQITIRRVSESPGWLFRNLGFIIKDEFFRSERWIFQIEFPDSSILKERVFSFSFCYFRERIASNQSSTLGVFKVRKSYKHACFTISHNFHLCRIGKTRLASRAGKQGWQAGLASRAGSRAGKQG